MKAWVDPPPPPDPLVLAAFAALNVGHGYEYGWIDDMGDESDPAAYVPIWRCTATGEQNAECIGCQAWTGLADRLDKLPSREAASRERRQ